MSSSASSVVRNVYPHGNSVGYGSQVRFAILTTYFKVSYVFIFSTVGLYIWCFSVCYSTVEVFQSFCKLCRHYIFSYSSSFVVIWYEQVTFHVPQFLSLYRPSVRCKLYSWFDHVHFHRPIFDISCESYIFSFVGVMYVVPNVQ